MRYNRFLLPEIDFKYLFDNYYISDWFRYFIASGEEVCHRNLLNDGIVRVDGKLIVASFTNNGTLKVVGTLETDSDLA